jgi:hypothetical protein
MTAQPMEDTAFPEEILREDEIILTEATDRVLASPRRDPQGPGQADPQGRGKPGPKGRGKPGPKGQRWDIVTHRRAAMSHRCPLEARGRRGGGAGEDKGLVAVPVRSF